MSSDPRIDRSDPVQAAAEDAYSESEDDLAFVAELRRERDEYKRKYEEVQAIVDRGLTAGQMGAEVAAYFGKRFGHERTHTCQFTVPVYKMDSGGEPICMKCAFCGDWEKG